MDPHWCLQYPDDHNHHHHQNQLPLVNTAPQYNPQIPHYHYSTPSSEGSNHLQQQLRSFWDNQSQENKQAVDFKNHSLPLARIKKIMKSDENVRMISADAPVVLSRACEMFIQDLTLRSWTCTEEGKRKTLQKADISAALSNSELFDFLVDILPREMPFIPTITSVNLNSSLGIVCEDHQQLQQQDGNYSVCEGAGLTMGLQIHQLAKDNHFNHGGLSSNSKFINEGWPNYLSNHPAWPPPDF